VRTWRSSASASTAAGRYIRDLRITASTALEPLATGATVEVVLDDYPYPERADVLAAPEYAAIVNERDLPIAHPSGSSSTPTALPRSCYACTRPGTTFACRRSWAAHDVR
jgi:uncharacterized protein (DUF433 family)